MNCRHMTDDHHSRTAGRATLLVRAVDEILGTHRRETSLEFSPSLGPWRLASTVSVHEKVGPCGTRDISRCSCQGPKRLTLFYPCSGLRT
jgi:hypothetical protein